MPSPFFDLASAVSGPVPFGTARMFFRDPAENRAETIDEQSAESYNLK